MITLGTNEAPYEKAFLGGTFDNFHEGHKLLITTACKLANDVFIGVISDNFGSKLFKKKVLKERIETENIRISSVRQFLEENDYHGCAEAIHDPYGPSITDVIADLIVVSHETRGTADEINRIRLKQNLPQIDIVTIPWFYDFNGRRLSSTLIRKQKVKDNL